MEKLQISDIKRNQIYREVKKISSSRDIYFPDHVKPVAENCLLYATHLSLKDKTIDPVVCELGGLLHDVGYSNLFESDEKDHIKKGIIIAPDILEDIGVFGVYAEQIIDTIWTHDGNLNRSRYNLTPTNNIIVNDVDAMHLFDWNLGSLFKFSLRLKPNRPIDEVAKGLMEHVEQTIKYISMPFFRDLATPKYNARMRELETFIK